MSRRHIGGPWISLARRLDEMAVESLFVPAVKGLAAEVGGGAVGTAYDLSFFHRHIDLASSRITEHAVEFCAHGLL